MKKRLIDTGKGTLLCGILNITPDSFSDGGCYDSVQAALDQAQYLIEQGVAMLDVGGESTRPGSHYVEVEEEIVRVVPVIKALRKYCDLPISIDTWKSQVADAALAAGADYVNDITGLLGDSQMARVAKKHEAGLILMFNATLMRPHHSSAKIFPKFGNEQVFSQKELASFENLSILELMDHFFDRSLKRAEDAKISKETILLDPGIGFGLTHLENLQLVDQLKELKAKSFPIFLGVSRKRFLVKLIEDVGYPADPGSEEGFFNRDLASAFVSAIAAREGVAVLRVHDPYLHRMAVTVGQSIEDTSRIVDMNLRQYDK